MYPALIMYTFLKKNTLLAHTLKLPVLYNIMGIWVEQDEGFALNKMQPRALQSNKDQNFTNSLIL